MPFVVVDTNILVRVLVPSQRDSVAEALFSHLDTEGLQIAVPGQVASEAMNQIRRAVTLGQVTQSEGTILLRELQRMLEVVHGVQWSALALAHQFNRPTTYDCEAYALAQSLEAHLWTADDRFVNAMQAQRPAWVHRLSDFDPATTT